MNYIRQTDEEILAARRFRVVRHRLTRLDGTEIIRETVQHPGAVTVVPCIGVPGNAQGQVCLVRNWRVAVGQTLLELPAGTLEVGEDPLDCARRELAEETGYQAQQWQRLTEFFMSPGILNERMHLFMATELTAGPATPEADEDLESVVLDWDEALRAVEDGRICDAKSVAGLLLADRVRRQRSS